MTAEISPLVTNPINAPMIDYIEETNLADDSAISDVNENTTCMLCGLNNHPYLGSPIASVGAHSLCIRFAKGVKNKKKPLNKAKFEVEVTKAQDVICVFCSKPGASAGCWKPNCSVNFHLPCSVGMEVVNRHDIFMSYCREHSRRQEDVQGEHQCGVCGWLVEEGENFGSLVTTCCDLKHHRGCLQVGFLGLCVWTFSLIFFYNLRFLEVWL